MNKDVQNYLSDNENNKTNKILQFIARNKESLKKAIALGVSTATLLTMLASCDPDSNKSQLTDEYGNVINVDEDEMAFAPKPELKPIEEMPTDINQITAQDVIDIFNYIAYLYFEQYSYSYENELGENFDKISCEFLSFGPCYYGRYDKRDDIPEETQYKYFEKIDRGSIHLFGKEFEKVAKNYYYIGFMYNEDLKITTGKSIENNLAVPAEAMERLIELYGGRFQEVTMDYLDYLDLPRNVRKPNYGTIVLIGPNFTKSMIKEANPEQLKAFYDVAYSIYFAIENLRLPSSEELPSYQKNLESNNMEQ